MSVQAKRWTREEYERMVELGLLAPDSHVQLIDGEILQMALPGAPHSTAVGHVQDAASDVVLAVEVSDTSIELDRRRKARLYARAGIPEYWVVALEERIIEVFTGPGAAGYERRVALRPGDTASPAVKPDAKIDVASLLP
jgi:Uma2 family endonuclease